jgi:beta-lactamase regulating signal transducer with metallopeptidase domain/uncharacterized protein YjbI with pentapeptide repeats
MIPFGMNLQDVNDFFGFDFSATLCLTLLHSLWQIALLAYMAKEFVCISCRKDAQWGYGIYVWTLLMALLALPATFVYLTANSPDLTPVLASTEKPTLESIAIAPPSGVAILPNPEALAAPISQPEEVASPVNNSFSFEQWAPKVLLIYMVGVFIMLTRLGWSFVGSQYLARHGEPITVGPVVEALDRLIHAWQMRVRPVITHASDIVVPQVVGLLRPTILIPTSALTGLTPAELEMILAHELAHVRRLDMWVNLLQRLAEAVLFFNPALWYLSRQISTYREYCCDELTCGGPDESPSNRLQYAQALLRVVELSGKRTPHGEMVALAATGNRPSELRRRVARLFGEPLREPVGMSRFSLAILITGVVLLFAVPIGLQNAAEIEPSSPETTRTIEFGNDEGGEVEVLGIGTYEENPNRWWNERGESLDNVPFHVQGATVSGESRQLVFQITNLPREADVKWELKGSGSYATGEVVLDGEESPFGYFSNVFEIKEDSPTIDLRLGVATGEWKTITTVEGADSQSMGLANGKNIAFAGAFAEEDRHSKGGQATSLILSHNFKGAKVRIVAFDKAGRRCLSSRTGTHGVAEDVIQVKYTFRDLLPDELDHFEFQQRDYKWIEIKDLPVNPSTKVAQAPSIDPAELKYEIVAIGTHEAEPQTWWDAEGQPLGEIPFEWYDTDRKLPEGTTWRRVVIRVSGLPENHEHGDMTWRLPDARYYWGAYVKPTDPYDPHKYYARYFQWNGKNTFDLKMGLAQGEWQTVTKGTMANGPRPEDIIFSDPMETEDGLTVFVSHNVADRPYRIMAIDRQGRAHRSVRGGGTSINNIVQSQGQFPDLDEDDVDHFEFQVRDYEWSDIKGLPAKMDEQAADLQKLQHLFASFGNDANSSLVASDTELPEWLVPMKQRASVKSYVMGSKDDFVRAFETHFDAYAGYEDAFDGVMEGLERDPNGPQIDVLATIKADLGNELIVANFPSNSAMMKNLICWNIQNQSGIDHVLSRFMGTDPNAQQLAINGTPCWKVPNSQAGTSGVCVFNGYLIIATDFALLQQVLAPTESGAPSKDASVDSAKLEALKELVEAYETDYERVEALFEAGVEGGEPATKAQALIRLALARADLAELEKDSPQRGEQLDIAYKAAEEAVEALEHKYAAGRATIGELSAARADRARIKMKRADIKNDVISEVESDENKQARAGKPEGMLVKIADVEGNPLEGAWVFRNLTFNDPEAKRSRIKNETYYTDKNGEAIIKFEGEPINLNIWVKKESHVPLVTSWRDVTKEGAEQIPLLFEFRMTRGTKIGGIVTDVAGIPIAGVKVEVEDASLRTNSEDQPKIVKRPGRSNWLAYGDAGVMTDAEGKWSLDNVPASSELLAYTGKKAADQAPLRLRFSHPDYETIDGIEQAEKVGNPSLQSLREGSSYTVMKWVDRDNRGQVNAVRLEQGEQYKNADFSGRHFKGQELMVWSDEMLAGANLVGSIWEDMMVPGVSGLLYEADMTDAKILVAQLIGQSSGIQRTNFTRAILDRADLSGGASGLQLAKFMDAKITNSSLYGEESAFQEASFENAKLHSTKLSGKGSAFQKSNFNGAKLYRTTVSCDSAAAFQGVKLNNTEFVECDLSSIDAEALRSCEFDTATPPRYDAKTKLPKGFDPPAAGWKLID